MILPEMLVNKRGMFLVRLSLYNPSFCSDSTNTNSNCFFVKRSLLVKFIWSCMSVLSFVLIYIHFFSIKADFFLEWAKKKLFQLCLNATKRLWCTADTQVFLAFSSTREIFFENFCFSIYAFARCWQNVFSIIAIIAPLP